MYSAGDDSCPNSNLTLYCEEACPLKINGDRAAAHAIWNIVNARFLDANGDKSLSYSDLNIEMDNDGGSLIVSGDDAALYASWIIKNANKLTCSGYQACKNSRFSIEFIPELSLYFVYVVYISYKMNIFIGTKITELLFLIQREHIWQIGI